MPAPASTPPSHRWYRWLGTLGLTVGAALRFLHVGVPEPFVDEAGNVLTALDPRVGALVDPIGQGRPLLAVLFNSSVLFPTLPLEAARVQTGLAGLLTALLLAWVLRQLWGRCAALLGLWLWATLPLLVFHERLALQDPYVALCLALTLALMVWAARVSPDSRSYRVLNVALGVGFGLATLMKISAVLASGWLWVAYLLVQRHYGRRCLDGRLGLAALGVLLPYLALGSDLFHLGANLSANHDVVLPVGVTGWVGQLKQRGTRWLAWQVGYGGWPLLILVVAALLALRRQSDSRARWLGAGWMATLALDLLVYNRGYARYSVPDAIPLVLFLAATLGGALEVAPTLRSPVRRRFAIGLLAVPLAGLLTTSVWIAGDARRAPIPQDDIRQYFTGPWSGRGTAEVRRFLTDYADQHHVQCLVLTHRALRPGCYALMLAELGDPRLGVVPQTVYEPAELDALRPGLRHVSVGHQVAFFLLYEGSLYPAPAWLDRAGAGTPLVHTVDRGAGETFRLYQFEP